MMPTREHAKSNADYPLDFDDADSSLSAEDVLGYKLHIS